MKAEIDAGINRLVKKMYELYKDDMEYELTLIDKIFHRELKNYKNELIIYKNNERISICDIPKLDESIRKAYIDDYFSPKNIMVLEKLEMLNSVTLDILQDTCKDIRIPITEKIQKIAREEFKKNILNLLENYSCQSSNVACTISR